MYGETLLVREAWAGLKSSETVRSAPSFQDPWLSGINVLSCILSVGFFGFYVWQSRAWIVMWDGAVMHYIHFLITKGFRPYVDITDMNLPGSYLTEGWAMSIFGWGDAGWRVYECFLMLLLLAGGLVIGGARHWMCGVYAALLFTLMHGAQGPMMAVERDEIMTVLLVAGMAFCFVALRWRWPALLFPFGLLCGLGAGLKPGAVLLDASLMLLAAAVAFRRGERPWWYLFWALTGNLVVGAVMIGFVLRYHSMQSLVFITRHILPSYVKEKNQGSLYLLQHLLSPALWPLAGLAVISLLLLRRPMRWERMALLLGMLSGFTSYWIQRKGYLYHGYMFTVFLLLWASWEIGEASASRPWIARTLQGVAFAYVFLWAAPGYAWQMYRYPRTTPPPQNLALALQADLEQLGGASLQHQVQCFDLVNGCLNALYRLRLVQNTGTTGDLLLFSPKDGPAVKYYRHWFQIREERNPPTVIVLGNEYYHQVATSFDKVKTWPGYADYLHEHYEAVIERHFGHNNEPAYRILLRKGSPVFAREQANPLR